MLSSQLIETLEKLSPDLQAEILHYAEYLAAKYAKNLSSEASPKQYQQVGNMNENLPEI